MGLFSPPKGSIGRTVADKIPKDRGRGAATQVQAKQAKERKKEIKEAAAKKKQDKADIRRAKLLSLNGPPNAGKSKKFNEKAIAKGDKRREKKEMKKAERKAKGFWG